VAAVAVAPLEELAQSTCRALRQPAACRQGPGTAHGGPGRRRGWHIWRGVRMARRVRAVGPRPPDLCPADVRRRQRVVSVLRPPPPLPPTSSSPPSAAPPSPGAAFSWVTKTGSIHD
jgi:hypothetical protein